MSGDSGIQSDSRRGDGRWRQRPRADTLGAPLTIATAALLTFAAARFFWALATPIAPLGDWPGADIIQPSAPAAPKLDRFDPFFRTDAAMPGDVTALDLRLYGVRQDQASGRGAAIIGAGDGTQQSYAVGEIIAPGVRLAATDFDHVTLLRAGRKELLFLDQSEPAGQPASAPPSQLAPAPVARTDTASLQPGDVLVAVDGVPVPAGDPGAALAKLAAAAGRPASVTVNRGGALQTFTIQVPR